MSPRPRTHRDTALVVLATAGGASWLAPLAILMDGRSTAGIVAMIAGCGIGALVAVTATRMSALAAAVAGALSTLLLEGVLIAMNTHSVAFDAVTLQVAAGAGVAAAVGALIGGRWRGRPMVLVASAMVSLGVVVLTCALAALAWELLRPLPNHAHVTVPAVLLGAPLLGGVASALVIPGCHPGHVAMSWVAIIVSMTFAIAIAARTPLVIGPGLLAVLILAPFLSGLGALGAHLITRGRHHEPAGDLPEARAL